jgi:hypothetical protein
MRFFEDLEGAGRLVVDMFTGRKSTDQLADEALESIGAKKPEPKTEAPAPALRLVKEDAATPTAPATEPKEGP